MGPPSYLDPIPAMAGAPTVCMVPAVTPAPPWLSRVVSRPT